MCTLWDLGQVYCEICEIGQLRYTYDSYNTMVIVESSRWLLMAWCLFGHHDQQPSSARARVDWCIPGSSQCYGIHCAVFVQFWNANVVMVTTTVASLAAITPMLPSRHLCESYMLPMNLSPRNFLGSCTLMVRCTFSHTVTPCTLMVRCIFSHTVTPCMYFNG